MAYSYLLAVEGGCPGSEDGKDAIQGHPQVLTVPSFHRSLLGSSFLQPSWFLLQTAAPDTLSTSFSHSTLLPLSLSLPFLSTSFDPFLVFQTQNISTD